MLDLAILDNFFDNTPPLPNNWGGRCFGCSRSNPQGLHLEFWSIGDFCASRFQVPADLCGFDAIAHGGIVASVLDEAGAWVIVIQLGKLGLTQDAGVRYHHTVPTCTNLVVTSQITSCDMTQVTTRAEIRGRGNRLLAEAESHWILPPLGVLARVTQVDEGELHAMLERFLAPIREHQLKFSPLLPSP